MQWSKEKSPLPPLTPAPLLLKSLKLGANRAPIG